MLQLHFNVLFWGEMLQNPKLPQNSSNITKRQDSKGKKDFAYPDTSTAGPTARSENPQAHTARNTFFLFQHQLQMQLTPFPRPSFIMSDSSVRIL